MKRMFLSLITIAVVAALTTFGSLALFTDTTSNTGNTFTAGEVSLSEVTETLVDVGPIAPGDGDVFNYHVSYSGNIEAWLGLDTEAVGELLTCNGDIFELAISDGTKTYNNNAPNQVIGHFNGGHAVNLSVTWELPLEADNDCEGDGATLSMKVHAVQYEHNINAAGDGPISWLEDPTP